MDEIKVNGMALHEEAIAEETRCQSALFYHYALIKISAHSGRTKQSS